MKIVGLIAEYNPFHNGHEYHIRKAKEVSGADAAIVIMSGDYVQRGVPAIMPKRLRARMALLSGADAVFELPVCYSTASAELFAEGAVSFLEQLGVVDHLCFGSECNDLAGMKHIADILYEEPDEYRKLLQEYLRAGNSFPAARQMALSSYLSQDETAAILNEPNNILGIEYLKALRKFGSDIRPFTIRRLESGYHDQTLCDTYSSASAIRALLSPAVPFVKASGSPFTPASPVCMDERTSGISATGSLRTVLDELKGQIPEKCLVLLKERYGTEFPIDADDFSLLLKYRILTTTAEELISFSDLSEELANRISRQINNYLNYTQFSGLLKTKELTQTRINRALLHILIGIKKDSLAEFTDNGYHFYARLLGFRKDSEHLISAASKRGKLRVLASPGRNEDISPCGQIMLRQDILASSLYNSVVTDKFRTAFQNEYSQKVIKL